ncbi:MAG: galactose mutarotase [Muribaculaceae bacterium]|nr:galactose mutarotase [Muribaculaceae bacterium]
MNLYKLPLLSASALALLVSCASSESKSDLTASGLDPNNFVADVNGKTTALYQLKNANGMEVCITNFGGRIVSIMAPDRDGNFKDVVLGFDSIADYINIPSDFGAAIGRYANRIDHGRLIIDGDTTWLPTNNIANPAYRNDTINEKPFVHHLHGGPTGWQYQVYDVKEVNDSSITLVMNSPDGDNNFPGNLTAEVTYTLTADNAVNIAYKATTDKPTVINMTNHSYFNLNGDPQQPITNCILQVNASEFTPVDSTFMTTGEIVSVKETPFDFTQTKAVGEEIDVDNVQVKNGNGYDHNWVLDTKRDLTQVAAELASPVTGITLTVYTDEPGIQVYTGNFLDGTVTGKNGNVYNKRAAICLETQHYPDSPNKPQWPSVVLRPGETYTSNCIYKFGTQK